MFEDIESKNKSLAERFPQKQPEDRAYDATRVVLSFFPNGAPAELFAQIISAPIARRKDEWFIDVASAVDEIVKWKEGLEFGELQKNEQFISALVLATRIATGTHQREKRAFLRNALVKIGAGSNVDEDLQFVYLRLVEDLTPTHVRVLDFLWRGNSWLVKGGVTFPVDPHQYLKFAEDMIPELKSKAHFVDLILRNLRSHGLCTAQDITAGSVTQTMTNHGIGFLSFVMEPDSDKHE